MFLRVSPFEILLKNQQNLSFWMFQSKWDNRFVLVFLYLCLPIPSRGWGGSLKSSGVKAFARDSYGIKPLWVCTGREPGPSAHPRVAFHFWGPIPPLDPYPPPKIPKYPYPPPRRPIPLPSQNFFAPSARKTPQKFFAPSARKRTIICKSFSV